MTLKTCTDLKNSDVTMDDLPEEIQALAEMVGMDKLFETLDRFEGDTIYFPSKKTLLRETRDRLIREQFDGRNYRELARKNRMSVRQVRNICNGGR